mmetsp:Transcript_19262/g.33059  ORF Transcript_19262/g.33059 Transcript_19262/m.33059 type:complete len:314 (-) Transcript_19262:524-1465(-)
MSENEKVPPCEACASCGIRGGDNVKLKRCTACKLVHYCSVACQKENRPQHKRACKRRAAELRDELLFRQPESTLMGDCLLCCLPLPLDPRKSFQVMCCSKCFCIGCEYSLRCKAKNSSGDKETCPFCRTPIAQTREECEQLMKKRMAANDPDAICAFAIETYHKKKHKNAFELCTKAAELGNLEAHSLLSILYMKGEGTAKDDCKMNYHLEIAAIGGHPDSRYQLGANEATRRGRIDRAVKHFRIAAALGENNSLEKLKESYIRGHVPKEDLAASLRAYKAAVDATKSPQRELAERNYNIDSQLYLGLGRMQP